MLCPRLGKDGLAIKRSLANSTLVTRLRRATVFTLCNIIKFLYGFLFGTFVWHVMVHPYGSYFNFEQHSYMPEFIFSVSLGLLFVCFKWLRTIMVLFLPQMIGNASQNYILIMLVISLFSNPVANIASNSVEAVRVIGCSLMMTFEFLKERAKLLLNPIIEVLSDRNRTDLEPIKEDLIKIEQTILDMRNEAEFNRGVEPAEGGDSLRVVSPPPAQPSFEEVADDVRSRLKLPDRNSSEAIVNKTMELLRNSTSLEFDAQNLTFRLGLDGGSLRKYLRGQRVKNPLAGQFNLTEIMYQNCLGIFRRAKQSCEAAVEEMRLSCQDSIGVVFSAIWCSPISFTLTQFCPFIMNQIVDENNLCKEVQKLSTDKLKLVNPVNGTGSINSIYAELASQVESLNDDLLKDDRPVDNSPSRFELNIALNSKTREVFLQTKQFVTFITDKYKLRNLFAKALLFLYELYTTLTFLCIIRQACAYRRAYLREIKFDNFYITGELVDHDTRRKRLNKRHTILPLSPEEAQKYITTYTCKRRTSEERSTQRVSCLWVVIFALVTLSLLYFDDVFRSILGSIQEHAHIRYKEIGRHELNIKVHGDGSIARMVRRLTGHLNSAYDLERYSSTKRCLPQVGSTDSTFYLNYLCLCLAWVFIDQVSIYAMRFRHVTCAFFYPEKESQRVEFLYKSILLQRKQLSDLGVTSYIGQDDENLKLTQQQVYTLRDAAFYVAKCVRESLACGCCRRRKRKRGESKVK